jgi:hypothetical protein
MKSKVHALSLDSACSRDPPEHRVARLTGPSMSPVEPKWQIVSQEMLSNLDEEK